MFLLGFFRKMKKKFKIFSKMSCSISFKFEWNRTKKLMNKSNSIIIISNRILVMKFLREKKRFVHIYWNFEFRSMINVVCLCFGTKQMFHNLSNQNQNSIDHTWILDRNEWNIWKKQTTATTSMLSTNRYVCNHS